MGNTIQTLRFYSYGRRHFTRNGWVQSVEKCGMYHPDRLVTENCNGKIIMVTGASSGIGKELSFLLASKGAKVYLVVRNAKKGEEARQEILTRGAGKIEPESVKLLIGDMAENKDVRRVVSEFAALESYLDVAVCNAGALTSERFSTSDGLETTFACHFLHGSYLLGKLLLPVLEKSPSDAPRLIFVTSGGALISKLPKFEVALNPVKYDGVQQYTYAKRAQMHLAAHWAKELEASNSKVQVLSVHPGWTDTPGVESSFGSGKVMLNPMRSLYEGTEGIAWLCGFARRAEVQSGALYLDRQPQQLHLSSSSVCTKEEEEAFFRALQALVVP